MAILLCHQKITLGEMKWKFQLHLLVPVLHE